MMIYTDVVTYRWTTLDCMAAETPLPSTYVTPYRIIPGSIEGAVSYNEGDYVEIPLYQSVDIPTVARFYRDGYAWIPIPPGVDPGGTLLDLFNALYAYDPVLFAHCDVRLAMLDKGASVIQGLMSGSIPTSLESVLPLADLAQLHFDYWGNTDLRFAVLHSEIQGEKSSWIPSFLPHTMPWIGSDPLATFSTMMAPTTIPTQKDGQAIQYVLAQTPVRGVPIAAAPSSKGGGRQVIMSIPPPRIELDGFDRQILEPMDITSQKLRGGMLKFRITLPRPTKSITVEILRAGVPYYVEKKESPEFLIPGPHLWTWDGYDNNGIYDSNALRSASLTAQVTSVDMEGHVAASMTTLGTGPDVIRWTESYIDTNKKRAEVTIFANIMQPSDISLLSFSLNLPWLLSTLFPGIPGISSLPGADQSPIGMHALTTPGGVQAPFQDPSIPIDVPSTFNLDPAEFAMFKQYYVIESIERFWTFGPAKTQQQVKISLGANSTPPNPVSVEVTMPATDLKIGGESWEMAVSCKERSTDGMTMILAKAGSFLGMCRSINLATLLEGLPIIDQYNDPTAPYKGSGSGTFADVGGHELGHSVLREMKGVYYSLTHKGTTSPFQEAIDSDAAGWDALDDVMSVLTGSAPSEYQSAPVWDSSKPQDVMLYPSTSAGPVQKKKYKPKVINGKVHAIDSKGLEYSAEFADAPSAPFDGAPAVLEALHAVQEDACGLLWVAKVAFG